MASKVYTVGGDKKAEEKQIRELAKKIEHARECIQKGSWGKAQKIVDELLPAVMLYSVTYATHKGKGVEYFSFSNILEAEIYKLYFKPKNEIRAYPFSFSEIDFIQGAIYFEHKRFDEAEKLLKGSLERNPVSTETISELAEIYKIRQDWKKFLSHTNDILKYAYHPGAIARALRNLGFYYIEKKDYETAVALYFHSMIFKQSDGAGQELMYIQQETGKKIETPNPERVRDIFTKHKIQFGVNPEVLKLASLYLERSKKENNKEAIEFFSDIISGLTGEVEKDKKQETLENTKPTKNTNKTPWTPIQIPNQIKKVLVDGIAERVKAVFKQQKTQDEKGIEKEEERIPIKVGDAMIISLTEDCPYKYGLEFFVLYENVSDEETAYSIWVSHEHVPKIRTWLADVKLPRASEEDPTEYKDIWPFIHLFVNETFVENCGDLLIDVYNDISARFSDAMPQKHKLKKKKGQSFFSKLITKKADPDKIFNTIKISPVRYFQFNIPQNHPVAGRYAGNISITAFYYLRGDKKTIFSFASRKDLPWILYALYGFDYKDDEVDYDAFVDFLLNYGSDGHENNFNAMNKELEKRYSDIIEKQYSESLTSSNSARR